MQSMDSDSITKPSPIRPHCLSLPDELFTISAFFQHWDMERRWTLQSALHFWGQPSTYLQSDRETLISQDPQLHSPAWKSNQDLISPRDQPWSYMRINSPWTEYAQVGKRMDFIAVSLQFQIWSRLKFVHKYYFSLLIEISYLQHLRKYWIQSCLFLWLHYPGMLVSPQPFNFPPATSCA